MKTDNIILAALIVVVGFLTTAVFLSPHNSQVLQGNQSQSVVYSLTNSSTTVNTTSTAVIPAGWQTFASITNTGTSTISCYADGQTAASSSVQGNGGLIVQSNLLPGNSLTFGPTTNAQIPYVGQVNCLANVKQNVAVSYK